MVAPWSGEPLATALGLIQDGEVAAQTAGSAGAASLAPATPTLSAQIEALRKEQHDLRSAKKKLTHELRNAQRKKKRLCDRARQLSDGDLLHVLTMRQEARDRSSDQSQGPRNASSSTDGVAEDRGAPSGSAPEPST